MTTALLIGVLVVLAGLTLVLAGRRQDSSRTKYKQLAEQNLRLRRLVREIEVEARAQTALGNTVFEPTLALITDYREKEAA
jgi:hypothetical protein